MTLADPKYEEEVSGCTASVGIITHDKIYVVRESARLFGRGSTDLSRVMLVTPDPSSESKAEPSPSLSTTSRRTRARRHEFAPLVVSSTLAE